MHGRRFRVHKLGFTIEGHLHADAVAADEGRGVQVRRLVAQVVADLAARRPGVDPVAHAVDPQVSVARPLVAERHRVVEQQAHSLEHAANAM